MGERFSLNVDDEHKEFIDELHRISHSTADIPPLNKSEIVRFLLDKAIEQMDEDEGLVLGETIDGEPIEVGELFDEHGERGDE